VLKRVLVLGVAVVLVSAVLYGVGAYLVYDEVSRTADPDAGRYDDVTPSSLEFTEGGVPYDFSRFETDDYSDEVFPSRDPEIQVHAWLLPGETDGPAIVVSHGLRASRHDPAALVPAAMLHAHGYTVVVIDLRDHGDSTFEDGRYAGGSEEQAEVLGAYDWLVSRGVSNDRIGLFGTSMGAGATLIAAAIRPGIRAVWEDSSYADTQTRIREELSQRGYPELLAPAAPIVAKLVAGDDLSAWTPLNAVEAMSGSGLFIAHGADDNVTYVHHARDLYDAAQSGGLDAEMWIAPEMGHTEAYKRLSDEYETRLVHFFDDHLL